jgi:HAE1 family hydrophobic/amphiphilic exporter-1
MALAALAILGLLAYSRLPAELNPQVDIPTLTVTTIYPGAGPAEIESLVTKPLEDAVGAVNGVKSVYSSSQESVSIISMDLVIGTDLDKASISVREKVEAARSLLPSDARAPVVARLDINAQPILFAAFSYDGPVRELRDKVDSFLKPRIARVPGVAAVNVVGGEQREIRVDVDAKKLARNGITVEDVVNSVKAANQNVPAGSITQGGRDVGVRTLGAFTSIADIENTQVLAQSLMAAQAGRGSVSQSPLTIADVASIADTHAPLETITRVNGRDSVGIVVTRVSNANTVSVVDGAKEVIRDLQSSLPPNTQIVYARDDSILVRDALEDVNGTLILGAILAMGVVFLFLHNMRGTIIVALALPACLVATFLVMFFAGFSLNQMTLLALSLSVGILIDDSIVVLESITRHLGMGEPPEEAAFNGRTEIGFAGMTLTLVDVVVFLPIAFMGGIVGAFFRQFGITVVVATLFSLVVSFTVTPSLASRWYRQGDDPEAEKGRFRALEHSYRVIERFYRRVLELALVSRWWVVVFSSVGLVFVLLVALPSIGTELLPATDQGQIAISIELSPSAALITTDLLTRQVEQRIAGTVDVANFVSTSGQILGGFGNFPQKGSQFAQVNVQLKEKAGLVDRIFPSGHTLRRRSDEDIAVALRKRLSEMRGARITVTTVHSVANTGSPVQVQLRGSDLAELEKAGAELRDDMGQMPGVLDPDLSLRTGKAELRVEIIRLKASALGIAPAQAGSVLRNSIEGNADSKLHFDGSEVPIRIQLAGVDRDDANAVADIPIGNSGGKTVSVADIALLKMGSGPTAIERVNGQRMVTISANLAPGYPVGNAQRDIDEQIDKIPMPGITVHWSGEAETVQENTYYFAVALGLAVILVYLVMASLFNSLLNPFVIMFTLPMALIGAVGALAITGESISLVAMIGIIMLTGLMGRNAILLIDYIGTLRARGTPRYEAIIEAGATRLRPILMTTLATIFGMLPVALRIGRASELRAPMAIVVIGGLLLSTILTLIVIPVLYTLFDDLQSRSRRDRMNNGGASNGHR